MANDSDEKPTHISILIKESEYLHFRSCFSASSPMPLTYDEWEKNRIAEEYMAKQSGKENLEVMVSYDAFMRYCGRVGLMPTFSLLVRYASELIGR